MEVLAAMQVMVLAVDNRYVYLVEVLVVEVMGEQGEQGGVLVAIAQLALEEALT